MRRVGSAGDGGGPSGPSMRSLPVTMASWQQTSDKSSQGGSSRSGLQIAWRPSCAPLLGFEGLHPSVAVVAAPQADRDDGSILQRQLNLVCFLRLPQERFRS